jgi:hypothetical protein
MNANTHKWEIKRKWILKIKKGFVFIRVHSWPIIFSGACMSRCDALKQLKSRLECMAPGSAGILAC